MNDPTAGRKPEPGRRPLSAAISDGVVRVLHQHTGRGPTKARAIVGRDTIVVLMGDTLTKAERSLIEVGRNDLIAQVREELRQTMRQDLIAVIEKLTERRVVALMGGADLEPDVSCEVFLLDQQVCEGE